MTGDGRDRVNSLRPFLFGLIPSTEARLITTQTLVYLEKAHILGNRANAMWVIPDLNRMRAYNLSLDDFLKAMEESRMIGEDERLRQARFQKSPTVEFVLGWSVLASVHIGDNKPEKHENIIIKAKPEGEIVRLKDVATVQLRTSFLTPGGGRGTTENFVRIGHSLIALIVGCLGGALSRKFRPFH